ncbi:acyl-CoA dehydrogenase family protein [Rhodopseudomonas sp. HC1]|uniref:acyl-CoA dehydrogenase family protein n=1 Tax=Rhodopseudomonas infernalis TaxID=2897386 RepID=UPI001EE7BBC3|nr:acyl-CoA dehydrogenase family protein [Rhodopseudomonas infernalis]MCG6203397.1 acyl-CoA dehydrogenase family protein [Rhodopseudomonas infernalis]
MDFELSKEQQEIKARAAAFVEEVCRPLEDSWGIDDYAVAHDVLMGVVAKFREYGFRGLAVPKDAGGQGLGTIAKCLVYEEIVKSPVMHGLLATWSGFLDPHPALYVAPEWQKEAYLYPILKEDKFYHINISEPGAGSDAAGIETTAVRDGDNYVINGIKRWAPPPNHPGIMPKYLLCYAVTDPGKGYEGISLFLVDYPNPGVSVLKEYTTMAPGTYLGRSCDYQYKDCVVPAKNLLGAEGMGFRYMMDQLNRNRTVIGARLTGTARWAQTQAAKRARERETFGKPLSERQAIQWMLAESEMDLEQSRLMVYKTAWMLDHGLDARKEAAMVKCFAPLAACRVIDRAIQIHGGLGVLQESRFGQLYFQSRIAQVAEGTTEVMKMTIAREVLRDSMTA